MGRREWSVARQVMALQVVVVLVLVLVSLALAGLDARRDARTTATERALGVARTLADSPALVAALRRPEPSEQIQPMAEQVRRDAEVDFITVMSPELIRYSHPDPANIGKRFIGGVGDALQGEPFTQEYAGKLGPSMRAVVPVFDDQHRVVGLVAVGITIDRIDRQLREDLVLIGAAAAAVALVGLMGAGLVARRLRRQTRGLGAEELRRIYEYHSAVLHAVREGLLLVDGEGRVQLVNDEAARLLELDVDDARGRSLDGLGLAPGLVEATLSGRPAADELYLAGDRMLVVNSSPATWEGRTVGAVVTLRDHTELRGVTGELDAVRRLTESLRAQNHEASNRLHTVVSLIEMGRSEEAVDFVTEELQLAQVLTDHLVAAVEDPVAAALLLGKTADAAERGIELMITGDLDADVLSRRDLVTVLGNLIDNAFDAVAERPAGERRVRVELTPGTIVVGDSGPGLAAEAAAHVTDRGWTTKVTTEAGGRGIGLALVAQVARAHGGSLQVGTSDLGGAEFRVELGR